MKSKTLLAGVFCLLFSLSVFAGDKKQGQRAMIEKMEAVPCGAKEHGMNGLGSLWASVGITSVNSDEKLCPQYMLRTDDMEYHIRPKDHKHPRLLPIGHEGEFKIDKDVMDMKIPDGDHKNRKYQVVSMKPIDHAQTADLESEKPDAYKPQNSANGKPVTVQAPPPVQPKPNL
jgi:hypothetical protein